MSNVNLLPCLIRLAQLQHESVDRLALQEAVSEALGEAVPERQIRVVTQHLQVAKPRWLGRADAALVPALLISSAGEYAVLRGKNARDQWVSEWWDDAKQTWREQHDDDLRKMQVVMLKLAKPFRASQSPLYQLISQEVFSHKRLLLEVVIGGLMINVIALATSFYSMHVYDRVVPTGSTQTLMVLTLGVLFAVIFEWLAKRTRTQLYERLIDEVDKRLARMVYMRFLSVRLDQLPPSVGALAGQMRGYETVRGFFTTLTTNFLVDAPFAVLFVLVIALIAGWLAAIPLLFFMLSVLLGLYYRRRVDGFAHQSMKASNLKTGLLVETVEGAETLKSGQGGWRMLSRWMSNTDEAREHELQMRHISEHALHLTAAFQQLSYVLIVAAGALLVSRGELTMGALIACSILSGRVLAPVATIPQQLVQWAHTKAALQGLDSLWRLQDDHHGHEPIHVEQIRGQYRLESVSLNYGHNLALSVPNLTIQAGEKVGVLGPIGSGKTSLLRLLSGMYKPQQGRIMLDDVDLAHIAKPALSDKMAYVQQEGRLFAGTLRDNLLLGLMDPGDETILQVAKLTGLLNTVIATHPKGLQQDIFEGGTGLSGGQRQLVNLTRAFLRKPHIWLLDEPTASMDRNLEVQINQALHQSVRPEDTLILVTHKIEMLDLVDRLIVIANHQVVLDGPKMQVLQRLNGGVAT